MTLTIHTELTPDNWCQARQHAVWDSWMLRAVTLEHPRPGWTEHAECAGCRTHDETLCATCPVRLDCLTEAVACEHAEPSLISTIRGGIPAWYRAAWYRAHPWQPPLEHGTDTAYHRCVKRPEGACDACKTGHATAERERRHAHRRRSVPPQATLTLTGVG